MTDPNFSAIRARLRYESIDDFIARYARFISTGGMFIPMTPSKLKPVGTTIRFQFLLQDGATAMLGEGVVRQIKGADADDDSAVGMLVKFTKLSRDSKKIVERIVNDKAVSDTDPAPSGGPPDLSPTAQSTVPAGEPTPADNTRVPRADAPQTRDKDGGLSTDQPEAENTSELNRDEYRELDAMFLPPDENGPDDDGPAAPPTGQSGDESTQPRSKPDKFSGNDVFAKHSEPSGEAADEAADSSAPSPGPQELGRTEAGLQIMAFDEVSADESAGLDEFAFGDEDEVDQMFDGIFGGANGQDEGGDASGGLFGDLADEDDDWFGDGGTDGGEGFFGDPDTPDATTEQDVVDSPEDGLLAETALDGGSQLSAREDADAAGSRSTEEGRLGADSDRNTADSGPPGDRSFGPSQPPDETYELEDEVVVDDEPSPQPGTTDQTYDLEDEIDLDDTSDEEIDEPEEVGPEQASVDSPATSTGPGADADPPTTELEDLEVIDEQSAAPKGPPSAPPSPSGQPPGGAAGRAAESSGPSADVMSALGALDSDADEPPEASGSGLKHNPAGHGGDHEDDEPDDSESLESLLAVAQQDLDAKKQAEEDDDGDGDILDDLLGSDDVPPAPSNTPTFDINDGNDGDDDAKKKKGGFISKLFGKD